MLDKFDYAEPRCPLCSGEEFYYPKADAPKGQIPVSRIIDKVDSLFNKNDYLEAGRLLEHWEKEAVVLSDKKGELAVLNELVGYYRKVNNYEKGMVSIERALVLTKELGQDSGPSGATVYINCATAYKAFGKAEKALPLYKTAEEIYKKYLNENDARFGGLYNNMALSLVDLDDCLAAEGCYNKALSVMGKAENGENEAAITYINMAHMYEKTGNIERINECMKKAYNLLKTKNLPHDGYYAFVLEKCAPSFGYFGFRDIYAELKKESEEIYERA